MKVLRWLEGDGSWTSAEMQEFEEVFLRDGMLVLTDEHGNPRIGVRNYVYFEVTEESE